MSDLSRVDRVAAQLMYSDPAIRTVEVARAEAREMLAIADGDRDLDAEALDHWRKMTA